MSAEVIIVGAGPVGMTLALLLAEWRISTMLIEKGDGLPATPRAHVIRQRSMDIFAKLGLADEIRMALPDNEQKYVSWAVQLAGTEIGRLDLQPGGCEPAWTNLPQNLLAPILLAAVKRCDLIDLRLNAECVGVTQTESSVKVEYLMGPDTTEAEAKWLVATDGAGSRIRDAIGISMSGPESLGVFDMLHFEADLSPWVSKRPGPITWILHPESPGALIVHEPTRSHVFMTAADGAEPSEEKLTRKIQTALGSDARIKLLSHRSWVAQSQIAETYRCSRVFLAGDAAHRFPPTGGLGLNTGIVDAHNLAWKLALRCRNLSGDWLLDSYETECRAVAQTNAEASLGNQLKLFEVHAAIGAFSSRQELEEILSRMDDAQRAQIQSAIDNQIDHFVSDGLFPSSIQGFEHEEFAVPPDYQYFRLLADQQENELFLATANKLRVPAKVVRRADQGESMTLLRPDDQVMWKGSSEEEAIAALQQITR